MTIEMIASYNWFSGEDIGQPKDQGSSLLVNNLHPDATEKLLHTIYHPFGPLSVYVCRNTITNRSRGYGCGTFEHHDTENALEALKCSDLMGKPVRIMRGQDMTNKILGRDKESFSFIKLN